MHQPNYIEFAKMHLRRGPRLCYAERGDRTVEAVIFFHGGTDSWYSSSWVLPLPIVRDSDAFVRDTPPAGVEA